MGIANDISPKKHKGKKADISKENTKVEGENFEININNVPKYADDPFVFDHLEEESSDDPHKLETEVPTESVRKEPKEAKEEDSRSEQEKYFGDQKKKKGNPMTKWVVFLVIVLVLLLLYQNYSYIKGFFSSDKTSSSEESKSDSLYENDYTTETLDTTPESEVPEETESIDETTSTTVTTIDRASQSISVLNGNGISGSAKVVKTTLETAGFSVSHVGNALKFSYLNTEIFYNTGKIAEAEDMKSVLTSRTVEIFENSSVAGNYDIVVVVGAN